MNRIMTRRAKALGILAGVLVKSFTKLTVKNVWETDPGKFWQGIIDEAYEIWRAENDTRRTEAGENVGYDGSNDMEYKEFLKVLAPYQKLAETLGRFIQQVNNGGISQWIFNGYANKPAVIRYCEQIGTPKLLELADMLKATDMRSVDGWQPSGRYNQETFEKWFYNPSNAERINEEIAAYLYNEAIEGRIP